MANLDDIKRIMKLLPFTKEVKDTIIRSSEEIHNFNTFISEKYKIGQDEAENLVKEKISDIYQSQQNHELTNEQKFEVSSQNAKVYAESVGYGRSEELKNAILELSIALKAFNQK